MPVALVTGGAQRLGAAMARGLAGRGYDIALHYNSSGDAADALVDELRAGGRQAVALQADLLDEAQVRTLVPRAVELGPVLCLVNNASIFEYDNISTATRNSWDRHVESNLRAPFVLTQMMAEQVPEPLEQDQPAAQGLVINMVDQRVCKLTPEFMSYTVAKMGLWAFTQTAAQALAPRVRVNAIGPGPTIQGHRQSAEHFANQRKATILGRGADPAEIVSTLLYLVDAPSVTGQLICVDGGQHLGWKTPDVLGVE